MAVNSNQVERIINLWCCPRCSTWNKIWDKKCSDCQMTYPGRSQMEKYQYLLLMRGLHDLIPDVIPEQKKPLEELPSENDECDLDYYDDDE